MHLCCVITCICPIYGGWTVSGSRDALVASAVTRVAAWHDMTGTDPYSARLCSMSLDRSQ